MKLANSLTAFRLAQSPDVVAQVIMDLVAGNDTGRVVRVVDGKASDAKWEFSAWS